MKDKTVMKENTNICCCCSCLAVSKRLMWLGCRQELCNLEHSELSFKSESCEQGNHRQSSWQIRVDPMITEFGWSQVKYWFIIWGKTAIFEVQKSISKPPTHRQPGDMHLQSFDDAWLVTGFGLKSTFQKIQSDKITGIGAIDSYTSEKVLQVIIFLCQKKLMLSILDPCVTRVRDNMGLRLWRHPLVLHQERAPNTSY